jgi:Berberine and berberine like
VVANNFQNQGLFWALRGGGGGTFGVVISVTLQTFPEPPVTVQNLNVSFQDTKSLYTFTTEYLKMLPSLADAGGSGYWYVDPTGAIQGNGRPAFIVVHFFFNKTDLAALATLFEPLYTFAKTINGSESVNQTIPVPAARYVFPQPGGSDDTGKNVVLGTRLYSRANLLMPDGAANLSNTLYNITTHYPTIIEGHLTAGGKVAANADIDSALNPSWRLALGEVIIPLSWEDDTPPETQREMIEALTYVQMPQLEAVDPSMGAYTNEANAYEPEWQQVFWGSNYGRLLEVKNKWDPRGFFRCNRCVGSERWDASGNCPAP